MSVVQISLIPTLFLFNINRIVSDDFDLEEKYPKGGGILIQLTKPGLEALIFAAETAAGTI